MNILKNILLKRAVESCSFKEKRMIFTQSRQQQAPREAEMRPAEAGVESTIRKIADFQNYPERLEKLKKIELDNENFDQNLDKRSSLVDRLVRDVPQTGNLKELLRSDLRTVLLADMEKPENIQTKQELIQNGPYKIKLQNGVILFENTNKDFKREINLKEAEGTYAKVMESYRRQQEAAHGRAHEQTGNLREQLSSHMSLDSLINDQHKNRISSGPETQDGKATYRINFRRGRSRLIRLERETKIHDVLNLAGLENSTVYIRARFQGQTRNGIPFDYEAVFDPTTRGTFMRIDKPSERAKIFDGTKITLLKYSSRTPTRAPGATPEPETQPGTAPLPPTRAPGRPAPAEQPEGVPAPAPAAAQRPERAPIRTPAPAATPEERREQARLSERQRRIEWTRAERGSPYEDLVLNNHIFETPNFLREDSHFRTNWNRINNWFKDMLAREPFNMRDDNAQREYIQEVIQRFRNSRLHPSDFFRIQIAGKELYEGGYRKFRNDYRRLADMLFHGKINTDNAEWVKVQTVMRGVCSVLEAMQRIQVYDRKPESPTQNFRSKFLDIPSLTENEKAGLTGIRYHHLQSLLHSTESAPKEKMDIGATPAILREIQKNFREKEVPDMDINKYINSMGGLKLLFMAYGLDNLIAQRCIKKLDDTHYVLVKVPESGWQEALFALRSNNPGLWDTSKASFEKWERVRANLDSGTRARLFIERIFTPDKSTVDNDINWWKRLWHWQWDKEKKISMEYLGEVTLDTKDFEKHVVEGRGFRDMIDKTSEKVEGTAIYQPREEKVLKLANNYIEYGLLSSMIPATNATLPKVIEGIVSEFRLQGRVNLKQPYAQNKAENVRILKDAIALKDLNPDALSEAHIRFIRMGYVLGRQIETDKQWSETMSEHLSSNALIRSIQQNALEQGASVGQLKEIEQRVHIALFGAVRGAFNENNRPEFMQYGAGGAMGVKLGRWAGQDWTITLAFAGLSKGDNRPLQERIIPAAAIGARIKLGEKVGLTWSIGTTIGFTGASLTVDFPITSTWNLFAGVAAGIDWQGRAGVGGGLGLVWDQYRAVKLNEQKETANRGMDEIDKLIQDGNINKAAEAILKNEYFGESVQSIKTLANLDNIAIVNLYKSPQIKGAILNQARTGIKIPVITGFGAGVFAGVIGGVPVTTVGAYITIRIPGTRVNYVVRHAHPLYSAYAQSEAAALDLKKQLEREQAKGETYVIAEHTISANSGILYFDAQLGRSHVTRPRNQREGSDSLAVKESEKTKDLSRSGSFENIKRIFADIDIHAEKVPADPGDPGKGFLIALTPLRTENSNVEINIDPELSAKGLILDQKNNRLLIAASEAKNLFITRATFRYPGERRGALDLHVITFKTNANRSHLEIREDSPFYIYKYQGEQYRIVQGEARTGIRADDKPNVMTLEQFRERMGRGEKIETFKERKVEFSVTDGQNLTQRMLEAARIRELEPVRPGADLIQAADDWYKIPANSNRFDREIVNIRTINQEGAFKIQMFNELKRSMPDLNNQEFNLMYSYILDKSFTTLRTRSDTEVTRRLGLRNNLFREYMRRELNEIKTNNPARWQEITKGIRSEPTPDSISAYLMRLMPQNAAQLKEFENRKVPINENMKFASYTHRLRTHQAMPSSFGVENPEEFKEVFTMMNPTKLKLDAFNPDEKAAARFILTSLSPLDSRNLENIEGRKNFLKSELAVLTLSLYDTRHRVSPLIQVLGRDAFTAMTEIYEGLKESETPPNSSEKLTQALTRHEKYFTRFAQLVNGIRNAQLNGEPTYTFEGKYIFHLEQTEMSAGAYMKCGNGTITLRQRFGITTTETQRTPTVRWFSARTDRNVIIIPTERAGFRTMNIGLAFSFRTKTTPPPPETPKDPPVDIPPPETPGKNPVPDA